MTTNLPEKAHAELGASGADRWMNCTGSIRMTKDIPNLPTPYTKEGTAAHAVAEMALRRKVDAAIWIDTAVEGEEVTEEMADAVQIFVDYVNTRTAEDPASRLFIERRFSLDKLNPPAPMFGTSDAAIFQPGARRLVVPDYKHGVGYAVGARDNPQLLYYALGALLDIEAEIGGGHIDEVEIVIVQPRAAHRDGIIRSHTLSYMELFDFSTVLLEKAHETQLPNAPLQAGPWCRFCRAIAVCPAQLEQARSIAQMDFDTEGALVLPPAPDTLPIGTIIQILNKADIVEDWLRGVKRWAQAELEAGREVPGFKLVDGRATRKWADEALTKEWLELGGYTPEEYETRKMKSPAQVEALVKGGKRKKKGQELIPANLVVKESSTVKMVPMMDARPALAAGPQHDFEPLPAESRP